MWSDRRHDSTRISPGPDSRTDSVTPRTGLTMIGKGMIIKGEIRSREDLHVDGEVDGTLDVTDFRLTVGSTGKVGAGATAREVEVLGSVTGDVDATKKIAIRKGGRLVGDLRTPGIVIEDGAYFKGTIEILNTEERTETAPAESNPKPTTGA